MNLEAPIRFSNAGEFMSRPAWRDGLDPTTHRLKRIIGDYSFARAEALPCGLLSCRTTHQNGYVVETEDGLETHIGNHCGQRFFGVNWGDIQSTFRRASEDRNRQEFLDNTLIRRDELIAQIESLLQQLIAVNGATWEVLDRLNKESSLIAAVVRRVRDGGVIRAEREIDEDTARAMNLPQGQRTYMQTVGRVYGVAVIAPGVMLSAVGDSFRSRLRNALSVLGDLSATNLRGLNSRQRKERVKAVEQVQSLATETENIIGTARQFTAPSNLQELSKLPLHRPNGRASRVMRHFEQMGSEQPVA